jgi:hypothetical protein
MANTRHRNSIYVDTAADITVDAIQPVIYGVIITPNAEDSEFTLSSGGVTKIHIKIVPTETRIARFEQGIEINQTFTIVSLTNIADVILWGAFLKETVRARG